MSHSAVSPESNKSRDSYSRIIKSTALTGGSSAIDVILKIGRVKILAIILGPSGVGLIGLFTSISQMATSISILGIETSSVREIASANSNGNKKSLSRIVSSTRALLLLTGIVGTSLIFILSNSISQATFGTHDYSNSVRIVSLSVLFGTMLASYRAEIQGMRRIADLASVSVISSVLGTAATVIMVLIWRKEAIAPFIVVGAAIGMIATRWVARKLPIERIRVSGRAFLRDSGTLVRLGVAFLFAAAAGSIIAYFTRTLVVRNLGAEAAGYYHAASSLAILYTAFILRAMGADFFPRLSETKRNSECNLLVNEQTRVGMLLATPGVMATLTFAPFVIYILYSPKFYTSIEVLQWQVLGVLLQVLSWPMGYILPSKGMTRLFLLTEIVASIVHVSLIWVCLPVWGLAGTGIAYFLYYVFYGIFIFSIVRGKTGYGFSLENLKYSFVAGPSILIVFLCQMYLSRIPAIVIGGIITLAFGIYSIAALQDHTGTKGKMIETFISIYLKIKSRFIRSSPE